MSKFTKEFINAVIRWFVFILVSTIIFIILSLVFGFIQGLFGLDVKGLLYWFLGLTTAELLDRIQKIGERTDER